MKPKAQSWSSSSMASPQRPRDTRGTRCVYKHGCLGNFRTKWRFIAGKWLSLYIYICIFMILYCIYYIILYIHVYIIVILYYIMYRDILERNIYLRQISPHHQIWHLAHPRSEHIWNPVCDGHQRTTRSSKILDADKASWDEPLRAETKKRI